MAIDPLKALTLVAEVRRLLAVADAPRSFKALVSARLAKELDCSASLMETLLVPEERGVYDLPGMHYVNRGRLMDQIAAVLLFEPQLLPRITLTADSVRGHALHDILLAARVCGEPLNAKLDVDDMRRLVASYQAGECFGWYVDLYQEELRKLFAIEAAFWAALS